MAWTQAHRPQCGRGVEGQPVLTATRPWCGPAAWRPSTPLSSLHPLSAPVQTSTHRFSPHLHTRVLAPRKNWTSSHPASLGSEASHESRFARYKGRGKGRSVKAEMFSSFLTACSKMDGGFAGEREFSWSSPQRAPGDRRLRSQICQLVCLPLQWTSPPQTCCRPGNHGTRGGPGDSRDRSCRRTVGTSLLPGLPASPGLALWASAPAPGARARRGGRAGSPAWSVPLPWASVNSRSSGRCLGKGRPSPPTTGSSSR